MAEEEEEDANAPRGPKLKLKKGGLFPNGESTTFAENNDTVQRLLCFYYYLFFIGSIDKELNVE